MVFILPYAIVGIFSLFYSRIPFMLVCWSLGFLLSSKNKNYNVVIFIACLLIIILTYKNGTDLLLLTSPILLYSLNMIKINSFISHIGKVLGNISYPLYLCHYPIIMITAPFIISYGNMITFFCVNFLCIFMAFILYIIIDKNRNELINFFVRYLNSISERLMSSKLRNF